VSHKLQPLQVSSSASFLCGLCPQFAALVGKLWTGSFRPLSKLGIVSATLVACGKGLKSDNRPSPYQIQKIRKLEVFATAFPRAKYTGFGKYKMDVRLPKKFLLFAFT
jgi:hypothetical protein